MSEGGGGDSVEPARVVWRQMATAGGRAVGRLWGGVLVAGWRGGGVWIGWALCLFFRKPAVGSVTVSRTLARFR